MIKGLFRKKIESLGGIVLGTKKKTEQVKMLKPTMELKYAAELEALVACDSGKKPENWKLSPQAVRTFLLGSQKPLEWDGKKVTISKKFYGDDALVERSIVTLAGNRGLMLVGDPGTAKTMLSELLSAAICGTSTNTIQGTAGTTEDMIKYSWNYAMLLSKGPVQEALVPAPLYVGMKEGIITRFEEITRCPLEMQDAMISVMSDKILNIPELAEEPVLYARPGFNVIATANTRDKGINEMSSALKRRFNFETVLPVSSIALEAKIIEQECERMFEEANIDLKINHDVIELLALTFRELREGISQENIKVDIPSSVMSTAEAVSVYYQTAIHTYYYDEESITMNHLVQNIKGAVMKENREDLEKLRSYFNTVVKKRAEKEGSLWMDYYEARNNLK